MTNQNRGISGKWAVVTGASRGLGFALAWALAQEGVNLILTARSDKRLRIMARTLQRRFGVQVEFNTIDLSNAVELERFAKTLENHSVDFLVNNAGEARLGRIEELNPVEIHLQLSLQLEAPLRLAQAVIPSMKRNHFGRILNISSAGSQIGLPGLALYSAAKAGLERLSEGMRRELTPSQIRVSVLIPGIISGKSSNELNIGILGFYRKSPFLGLKIQSRTAVAQTAIDALIAGTPRVHLGGFSLSFKLWMNRHFSNWIDQHFATLYRPRKLGRDQKYTQKPTNTSSPRVLIVGATGFVGTALAARLKKDGVAIRCLVRDEKKAGSLPEGIEVFEGDILDPFTIREAISGIETAYYLVHSMDQGNFVLRDRHAAKNFATAASVQGVSRIIYLGALRTPSPSRHLQSRYEVEQILRTSAAKLTVLRASLILGKGSATQSMLNSLVQRLPILPQTPSLQTRIQPIALADVVTYLTKSLTEMATVGKDFDIGGEEIVTYTQLLEQIAILLGKKRWMPRLTKDHPRAATWLVSLLSHVDRSTALALFESVGCEMICSETQIRELIRVPLTSITKALKLDQLGSLPRLDEK